MSVSGLISFHDYWLRNNPIVAQIHLQKDGDHDRIMPLILDFIKETPQIASDDASLVATRFVVYITTLIAPPHRRVPLDYVRIVTDNPGGTEYYYHIHCTGNSIPIVSWNNIEKGGQCHTNELLQNKMG